MASRGKARVTRIKVPEWNCPQGHKEVKTPYCGQCGTKRIVPPMPPPIPPSPEELAVREQERIEQAARWAKYDEERKAREVAKQQKLQLQEAEYARKVAVDDIDRKKWVELGSVKQIRVKEQLTALHHKNKGFCPCGQTLDIPCTFPYNPWKQDNICMACKDCQVCFRHMRDDAILYRCAVRAGW